MHIKLYKALKLQFKSLDGSYSVSNQVMLCCLISSNLQNKITFFFQLQEVSFLSISGSESLADTMMQNAFDKIDLPP